jgi:hypothetical protein
MITVACSHFRSPLIYAEALASSCTFWGVPANSVNIWLRYDMETGETRGISNSGALNIGNTGISEFRSVA